MATKKSMSASRTDETYTQGAHYLNPTALHQIRHFLCFSMKWAPSEERVYGSQEWKIRLRNHFMKRVKSYLIWLKEFNQPWIISFRYGWMRSSAMQEWCNVHRPASELQLYMCLGFHGKKLQHQWVKIVVLWKIILYSLAQLYVF